MLVHIDLGPDEEGARTRQAPSGMQLHDILATARRNAGLRQGDIAQRLGVTRQTAGEWERGDRPISVAQAQQWLIECDGQLVITAVFPDGRYQL